MITKEPFNEHNLLALTKRFIKGNLNEINRLSAEGNCIVLTKSDIRGGLVKTEGIPYSPLETLNVTFTDGGENIGLMAITTRQPQKLN